MKNIVQYVFNIADLIICIKTDYLLKKNEAFSDFYIDNHKNTQYDKIDWTFHFHSNVKIEVPIGNKIYEHREYSFYRLKDNQIMRVFYDLKDHDKVYAYSVIEPSKKSTDIACFDKNLCYFSEFSNCFFHTSWEKVMSIYNRLIIHSACINSSVGGILFSGPSGIGKSTQANLWVHYEKAELINGDRSIVYKSDNKSWYAAGSPYSGSSRCYKNKKCELKAIVMLKKSDCCNIRKLSLAESFQYIYKQCTLYTWDSEFVNTVCDIILQICKDIPVYEYSCNMSQNSVQILKSELEGC